MMRVFVSVTSRVRVFILLALVLAVAVCYWLPAHFVLSRRLKHLQLLNSRLQEEIAFIQAPEGGGSTASAQSSDNTQSDPTERIRGSNCDTVHVGFIAGGYNASRQVSIVIKTILFYRHNPLHFHFVSDPTSQHILSTLLETWNLPAVNFSFYNSEPLKEKISWIPNFHYSGLYGLMKLVVLQAFPSNLSSIIMLDTDIMLNSDIELLWNYFTIIKKQRKLLGIVENQSNWYLGNMWENHRPWPALGRGFNTGVMLLNLEEMRRQDWDKMWSTVAKNHTNPTALADQDVINAVIKKFLDIHYVLPCAWNIQLGDNSLSEFCYQNAENFRIIHWNSPKKMNVEKNHGTHFRLMYNGFVQYDGSLLRRKLISCHSLEDVRIKEPPQESHDACATIRKAAKLKPRTHLFFLGKTFSGEKDDDVTLVSQLSMDRLQMLELLCHYWKGPMSISVYASDAETFKLSSLFTTHKCLVWRTNIAIHVIYAEGRLYPVNYLRNVAINHLGTKYAFLLDIDFVPMLNLYEYLSEAARVLGAEERALIVPAFETHLYTQQVPSNKVELIEMSESLSITPFRYKEWPKGHAPTNYEHWMTATQPYRVNWSPDFEPYVVLQRPFPRYDQMFVGFGWNKVSHIMELHYAGYEFVVLPDAFIIHMPHSPSPDISNFRSSTLYRDCLQVLKREFQATLKTKYPV